MEKEKIKRLIADYIIRSPFRDTVSKIALFGSYASGTNRYESDVDLLVEFAEPIGFFEVVRMEEALSDAIGKKVDLVTSRALSPYFREAVIREAETVYEK